MTAQDTYLYLFCPSDSNNMANTVSPIMELGCYVLHHFLGSQQKVLLCDCCLIWAASCRKNPFFLIRTDLVEEIDQEPLGRQI